VSYVYDDGGRAAAGFPADAQDAHDCVCRAIAIATERPYRDVYNSLNEAVKRYKGGSKRKRKAGRPPKAHWQSSPRAGLDKKTLRRYLDELGWAWTATMTYGTGCVVHLRGDELPPGRLIVSISRQLVAVIDGVIHDIENPSRDGTRCVYGYWSERP